MMFRRLLLLAPIILILLEISLSAGTTGTYSPDAMTENAKNIFIALKDSLGNIKWIFAILPALAISFITYRTIVVHNQMVISSTGGTKETVWIGSLINIVIGATLALASVYLIIGIFATVFGGFSNMNDAWNQIVVPFWKETLSKAPAP